MDDDDTEDNDDDNDEDDGDDDNMIKMIICMMIWMIFLIIHTNIHMIFICTTIHTITNLPLMLITHVTWKVIWRNICVGETMEISWYVFVYGVQTYYKHVIVYGLQIPWCICL